MSHAPLSILIAGLNYEPEPTGIAPYTTALAVSLVDRGSEVHVLTTHPHYPEWRIRTGFGRWIQRSFEGGALVERLRHYVPRHPTMAKRLISELSFGLRLSTVKWPRANVILLVSPAMFSSALAMARARCRRSRLPVVVWVQDIYGLGITETGSGNSIVARAVSAVERWLLRSADVVIVIHDRFARHLTDEVGIDAERIQVVRNWTHLPDNGVAGDEDDFRRQMGWGPNETIVLHAGAQGRKQSLTNVVEAAVLSDLNESQVRFVLMGNGSERRNLEFLAAGVQALSIVDPLPQSDFLRALSAADILLVSERSGMADMAVPSKLTSYFNATKPVIATTDEGSVTADEIRNSGAGLRVDADKPDQLLGAAVALRRDPNLASAMGASGRRYKDDLLSSAHALQRLADILDSLVDAPTDTTIR